MDPYLKAAIEEARKGRDEGGIPIGSVLVHEGRVIGRGHNRRVQRGSAILHGEMDALESAGRQRAGVYRSSTIYTTLSPCAMCTGAILLYGIPRVVVGENQTFMGEEELLRSRGVQVQGAPLIRAGDRGRSQWPVHQQQVASDSDPEHKAQIRGSRQHSDTRLHLPANDPRQRDCIDLEALGAHGAGVARRHPATEEGREPFGDDQGAWPPGRDGERSGVFPGCDCGNQQIAGAGTTIRLYLYSHILSYKGYLDKIGRIGIINAYCG